MEKPILVQPERWLMPHIITAPVKWEKLSDFSMCFGEHGAADVKNKLYAFWTEDFVQSFTSFRDCKNKRQVDISLGHLVYSSYPDFYFYIQASEGLKSLDNITSTLPSLYINYDNGYNHPIFLKLNMAKNLYEVYNFPYWLPDSYIKNNTIECFPLSNQHLDFDKNYFKRRNTLVLQSFKDDVCDIRFIFNMKTEQGKYEFRGKNKK